MAYKNKEKAKQKALIYYYRNHKRRLGYQRKYDKNNKEKKREYDKKRRELKDYNQKKNIQHFSKRNHLLKLKEKYGGCQICGSKNKLELHHKEYTKEIEDVMLLCQSCHKLIHRKSGS